MSADHDEFPDDKRLRAVADLLRDLPEPFDPPADLEASVMAAVAVAAASEPALRPAPPPRRLRLPSWRPLLAGVSVAVAAAAAAVVIAVGGDDAPVELAGALRAPGGAVNGEIEVARLGSGRRIRLDSDALEILPTGEYYEVWFVGAGDTPQTPNRISAGTFHPDEQGVTAVTLHAAVDPAKLGVVEITAEPGNGDPGVDGPVVARLDG